MLDIRKSLMLREVLTSDMGKSGAIGRSSAQWRWP